ncbi:MAG: hypothetical protein D4R88_01675 [Methanosarcinales archaeon]|nr:MAG: hypothetical protein D4R88_01675 [Methanosarcinales archaeon]
MTDKKIPMLSEHANEIKKDIDKVRKKKIDIDHLLQKYHEEPERDFIQKYAETEIASLSKKLAWVAFFFSLAIGIVGIMGTLGAVLFPGYFTEHPILFNIIIILYFILLVLILPMLIKGMFFGKDIFKEIIIKIEDINMETKPTVISKLDVIIPTVEAINPRIDDLEKKVSNKIEAIENEIMSIKSK